eukprot:2300367-Amphidinium_carterae.1
MRFGPWSCFTWVRDLSKPHAHHRVAFFPPRSVPKPRNSFIVQLQHPIHSPWLYLPESVEGHHDVKPMSIWMRS